MNELIFDKEITTAVIKELIPSYQQDMVLGVLNATTEIEFDSIGMSLTGELRPNSVVVMTSSQNPSTGGMLKEIKSEIYDFFCTTSKKYKDERSKSTITLNSLILVISNTISAYYHIAVGVVIGAVTVVLIGVLKIGKNAWCNLHQSST